MLLLRRLNLCDPAALSPGAASGAVWALGALAKGFQDREEDMGDDLLQEVGGQGWHGSQWGGLQKFKKSTAPHGATAHKQF